jgi:hypothetical protein
MSDRERQRLEFLKTAGLSDAVRTPLAGDRSRRVQSAGSASMQRQEGHTAAASRRASAGSSAKMRNASGSGRVSKGVDATTRRAAARVCGGMACG